MLYCVSVFFKPIILAIHSLKSFLLKHFMDEVHADLKRTGSPSDVIFDKKDHVLGLTNAI